MNRKKILLVDADSELLQLLATRCREIGLDVDVADDASAAVALLEKREPDLICVDAQLPGSNGLRLSEIVLKSPDDVACPVIILTNGSKDAAVAHSSKMCVYSVQKRPDLWRFLEPVIYELIDIQPVRRRTNDQEEGLTECVS
jgi:CheY-like chemotaxis protein